LLLFAGKNILIDAGELDMGQGDIIEMRCPNAHSRVTIKLDRFKR